MTFPENPDSAPRDEGWRIDDLAQRAGVSVDTIRYYQREGLLPVPERLGRSLRYGPEHLEQLERIRGLQARRFSLAAIRALLEHEGPVERLLAGRDGVTYDRAGLITAAGVTDGLFDGLERAGFLRTPGTYGRDQYDDDDLDVLRAFGDLEALGVPDDVIFEMAVVIAERIDQLQHAVISLFTGRSGPKGWQEIAKAQFEHEKVEHSVRLGSDMRQVIAYAHHRTIQRIVLEELRKADRD